MPHMPRARADGRAEAASFIVERVAAAEFEEGIGFCEAIDCSRLTPSPPDRGAIGSLPHRPSPVAFPSPPGLSAPEPPNPEQLEFRPLFQRPCCCSKHMPRSHNGLCAAADKITGSQEPSSVSDTVRDRTADTPMPRSSSCFSMAVPCDTSPTQTAARSLEGNRHHPLTNRYLDDWGTLSCSSRDVAPVRPPHVGRPWKRSRNFERFTRKGGPRPAPPNKNSTPAPMIVDSIHEDDLVRRITITNRAATERSNMARLHRSSPGPTCRGYAPPLRAAFSDLFCSVILAAAATFCRWPATPLTSSPYRMFHLPWRPRAERIRGFPQADRVQLHQPRPEHHPHDAPVHALLGTLHAGPIFHRPVFTFRPEWVELPRRRRAR